MAVTEQLPQGNAEPILEDSITELQKFALYHFAIEEKEKVSNYQQENFELFNAKTFK